MSAIIRNRAAEKARARARDEERLLRGEISPSELQRENLVFRGIRKDAAQRTVYRWLAAYSGWNFGPEAVKVLQIAQLAHGVGQRHCTQTVTCRDLAFAGIDQDLSVRFDVIDCQMGATRHFGCGSTLDLDRPDVLPGKPQNKVKLRTRCGPVEEGFGSRWRSGDQALDAEPFPASTDHRVPQQAFQRTKAKQRVDEAAIPDEDLWRLDEALADILVPRLQAPHQHKIDEQIKVSSHSLTRDTQTLG